MDTKLLAVKAARAPATRLSRTFLRQLAGYLFAAACLAWVLHDVTLREAFTASLIVHWRWIALAVALDISAYICQAARWRLLLRPVGSVPLTRTTQAIYVGLFSSEIMPLRAGELVRAYLMARWLPASFATVLSSVALERFFDGVWLALGIGLAALYVPLPANLLTAAEILGALILLGTALLVFVFVRYEKHAALDSGLEDAAAPPGGLRGKLLQLARAAHQMGRSRGFYLAFGASLPILLMQAASFWSVLMACGIERSLLAGMVVLLIIHLGTAIPNAPANLGSFQFFCVVGLTLFGVPKAQAAGFSMVSFAALTLPLWIIGATALWKTGASTSGGSLHELLANARRMQR